MDDDKPIIPKYSNKKCTPLQIPHKLLPYLVNYEDYDLDYKIGSGAFGDVWKATDKRRNVLVALKVLHNQDLKLRELQHFLTEVQTLVDCKNKFVVPFLGFTNRYPYCIATELETNGNLTMLIADCKKRGKFPGTTLAKIAIGVAAGMIFLHSRDIIHRDLKPSNILLTDDYLPMICDFGISRIDDGSPMTQMAGTPMWMAPEIINGKDYTLSADIFSFGMLLYEMNTFNKPFEMKKGTEIIEDIKNGNRPTIPNNIDKNMRKLIQQCWDEEPSNRPPFVIIYKQLTEFTATFENCDKSKVRSFIKQINLDQATMERSTSSEFGEHKTPPAPLTLDDFLNNPDKLNIYTFVQFLLCARDYFKQVHNGPKDIQVLNLLSKTALQSEYGKTIVKSEIAKYLPFAEHPTECTEFVSRVCVRSNNNDDSTLLETVRSFLSRNQAIYTLRIIQSVSMRSMYSPTLKLLLDEYQQFIHQKDCVVLFLKILLNYTMANKTDKAITQSANLIFSRVHEKERMYRMEKIPSSSDDSDEEDDNKVDDDIESNEFYNKTMKYCYKGLIFLAKNPIESEDDDDPYRPNIQLRIIMMHLEDTQLQKYVIKFLSSITGFPVNTKTIRGVLNACLNHKTATKFLLNMIDNEESSINYFLKHYKWIENELPTKKSTFQIFNKIAEIIKKKDDTQTIDQFVKFIQNVANKNSSLALECLQSLPKEGFLDNPLFIQSFRKSYVICFIFDSLANEQQEKDPQKTQILKALQFITEFSSFTGRGFSSISNTLVSYLNDEILAQKVVETCISLCSNERCKKQFLKIELSQKVIDCTFVQKHTKKQLIELLK